jgi:hypothetical protein
MLDRRSVKSDDIIDTRHDNPRVPCQSARQQRRSHARLDLEADA